MMSHNSLDELEEGEILEEIPPVSQKIIEQKILPRRYVLHENKSLHYKHKKTCRHAVRYHSQKLARLKKTSLKLKDPHKKHHKSCYRHGLGKTSKHVKRHASPVKENSVNNGISSRKEVHFSNHSLYVEMRNNFKNCMRSPHKIPVPKKSNSEKSHVNSVTFKSLSSGNPELLSHYTKEQNDTKNHLKIKGVSTNSSSMFLNYMEVQGSETLMENEKDADENTSVSDRKETCEESEDEEELRRIALATCAKRTLDDVSIVDDSNKVETLPSNLVSLPLAVQDKAVTSQSTVGDNQAFDNYEVVDMEVDEEEDILSDDQLFTIDKNPTPLFLERFENINSDVDSVGHSPKIQNIVSSQIDEDFDLEIQRAELVSNMVNPKKIIPVKTRVIKEAAMESNTKRKHVFLAKNHFFKSTKSVKKKSAFVRKHVKNIPKPESNTLSAGERAVIKRHERVIINVGETSTDESDQDDLNQEEINKENAVKSIEALISDARQKSDANNASNKVNYVPDAVSCLSKAQQEEYNLLKKLIAQKSVVPRDLKKPTTHSPSEDLKVLEKKFSIADENLQKEKLTMINMQKEFLEQKELYLKSMLTVQHLKEQLVAADRTRKSHFKNINTLTSKLGIIKSNVIKHEAEVNELKNECTKLGFSIRGHNYTLPPILSNLSPQVKTSS